VVTLTEGQGGQITINSKVWVKGNKVRVEMKHPLMGEMSLVADGKYIYQIDRARKQATKQDQMKATGGRQPWQMFVANVEQLREKARKVGSESIDGYACDIYSRSEGDKEKSASVRAWITRTLKPPMPLKVVRKMTIQRPNAMLTETTTVRIRNLQLNPPLADSLFTLPAGTRIVEGGPPLPGGAGMTGGGPGGGLPRGSR
jgi:outer membrane lipoprotein-sorting protein